MSKLVVLNLGKGDLHAGFDGTVAQIYERREDANLFLTQFTGSLPGAPELIELYRNWRILYHLLYDSLIPDLIWRQEWEVDEDIEIDTEDVTNVSSIEFYHLCTEFKNKINIWLNSITFLNIERKLRTSLNSREEIQVIIQTDSDDVRRLPWNLWDFFDDYPQAVLCLSTPNFERVGNYRQNRGDKIRILAILGNSEHIDTQADRLILENLPGAEVTFLVEPPRQQVDIMLWDERGWDILFFAGHSLGEINGERGRIYLNRQESLTIDQLKNGLKAAIFRGLRLAIFNSCDGLGLATQLASLHIPQIIVMREPVPDLIAQLFLKFFLTAFSQRKSFYLAVREAGDKLQGVEANYPCASWLPAVCQNPTEVPLVWSQEYSQHPHHQVLSLRQILPQLLGTSLAIATIIMGGRSMGWLENWELASFDAIMRSRPDEGKDERLLIVEITEADVQAQSATERGSASLADSKLEQLIGKLKEFRPRVIGLNIYRENSVKSAYASLAAWMETSPNLIGVCQASQGEENPGVLAPPEISEGNLGFSDVVEDNDANLRRHLLAMTPDKTCNTDKSFSFQLAERYLAAENINLQPNSISSHKNHPNSKAITFPQLQDNSGGYSNIDSRGYQIILNWRSTPQVASKVTLDDVLNNRLTADLVADKIVIIGTSAPSFKDYWLTPLASNLPSSPKAPGVVINAHMVSQLISASLDNRPLIWFWSKWGEAVWIYAWSVVAGILAWRCRSSLQLYLTIALAEIILIFICYSFLLQGGWIPLVPATLALISSATTMTVYRRSQN